MTESPFIIQLDETNFVDVVVEGSAQQPVLVDFWADWCGPCKSLMPILEKLAIEYNGAFILAKLDTDAHPQIAQQLGIRSLPTVKLFHDRQLVDEFMGALPEQEVRRFLEKHVSADEGAADAPDNAVVQAMQLFEQGDGEQARELLRSAQADDPGNAEILLALGQVSVATGDLDTARSCLSALPEDSQDSEAARKLAASLELAEETGELADKETLRRQLADDENNSEARYQLALHNAASGDTRAALDDLLVLMQKDPGYGDGAAQKKLISMFELLGSDPLAGTYRRKMFALLH